MVNVQELRSKTVNFLRENGPSMPVRIAKNLGVDPMWAGAILSELLGQQEVKFSSMKVGSSPIYFLEGQEPQLEKFADQYLGGFPKQAYLLLKKEILLEDQKQEPQIRVALRSLKDFAEQVEREGILFWKYKFLDIPEESSIEEKVEEEETPVESEMEEEIVEESSNEVTESLGEESKKEVTFESPVQKKQDPIERDLAAEVEEKLKALNIKLLEKTDVKKREFKGLGRMQGVLGETEILIFAKDKKNLTDKDFEKIFEDIKISKKQALLFITGEIAKKSITTYRQYKNIIKIRPL
jgi:hypothetical protein